MECPEENVIVDFVRGQLDRPQRSALERHIDTCPLCLEIVTEMARLFADDPFDDTGLQQGGREHTDAAVATGAAATGVRQDDAAVGIDKAANRNGDAAGQRAARRGAAARGAVARGADGRGTAAGDVVAGEIAGSSAAQQVDGAQGARIDPHMDTHLKESTGAFSPTVDPKAAPSPRPDFMMLLPQGAKLGRYVVLDRVGAGGMGVVYAAYDPELDRKVALKVLRRVAVDGSKPDQSDQRTRLLREAQAMAKLSHPNVITVHDVGTFEGQVFLAMEFIEGKTLGGWLKQGKSQREVLRAFRAAGAGLAAAHSVGLVHRDFKPDNVLMGNDGRVLVTDFGLARPAAGRTRSFSQLDDLPSAQVLTASLTQTGALVGTPAYMAPEQLGGERIGPQTDQFSFCVALFEALFGKRPFSGRSFAELATNIATGAIQPPPKDVRVPRWLRRVVLRGLAVYPQQRYPDMNALLDALHNNPWRPLQRWGLVLLPSALLTTGLLAYSQAQAPAEVVYCDDVERKLDGVWDEPRRQAVSAAFAAIEQPFAAEATARVMQRLDDYRQRWITLQTAACRDQVRGEQPQAVLALRMHCLNRRRDELRLLADMLIKADANTVKGGVDSTQTLSRLETCVDLDALTSRVAPPEDPTLAEAVAELENQLIKATILRESARIHEAQALVTKTVERAVELGYRPTEAEALEVLASLLVLLGDQARAETTYHRALSAALAAGHAEVMAKVSVGLVWITGTPDRDLNEAERWATHGLAAVEQLGRAPEVEAQLHHALGVARLNHGQYDTAEAALRHSMTVRSDALGQDHTSLGAVTGSMGQLLAVQGRLDEAIEQLERARELLEKEYGSQHPNHATAMDNLGSAFAQHGDYTRSRPLHEQALQLRERSLGPDHPLVAVSHQNLALTLMGLDEIDAAQQHGKAALEIFRKNANPRSLDVVGVLNILGRLAEQRQDYATAAQHHLEALDIAREHLGDHPRVARYMFKAGLALSMQGQAEAALEQLEQALQMRKRVLNAPHPDVAMSMAAVAEVLTDALKDADKALPLAEEAVRMVESTPSAPDQIARCRFVLARALWSTTTGRDRTRARTLAQLAQAGYNTAHPVKADEVGQWLDQHQT